MSGERVPRTGSISLVPAPRLQTVLRRWRKALKERGSNRHLPDFVLWEGDEAHKDLKSSGLLDVVMLKPDVKSHFEGLRDRTAEMFLEPLERAILVYVRFVGQVKSQNAEFKAEKSHLTKLLVSLLDESRKCSQYGELRKALRRAERLCRRELALLEKRRHAIWRPNAGLWAELLRQPKHRLPVRNMDLDGWFQITFATILRFFLRPEDGVSLRTISRLVVLLYVCCGFAKYRKDNPTDKFPSRLVYAYSGDLLTVDAVDQKLRAADVQNLPLEGDSSQPWRPELHDEEFD